MRLSAATNQAHHARRVLTAALEGPGATVEPDLRLEVNGVADPDADVDHSIAPFVPTAAVAALMAGEDLEVATSITATQADGARNGMAILASWTSRNSPALLAPISNPADSARGRGRGLLFTRGIDSWASLLTLGDRITHLVFVDGTEPLHSSTVRQRLIEETQRVADAVGCQLLVVTTNARERLDAIEAWDLTHGAALASAALAVSPLLDEVHVASSHPAPNLTPWGTHPDLDGCWSTPSTTFLHDEVRLTRWDKTALVAQHPLALDSLQVCWQGGTERNCGRCRKCFLTMTALEGLSAVDWRRHFDAELDPAAVAQLEPHHPGRNSNALDLVAHLTPGSELAQAWRSVIPDVDLAQLDERANGRQRRRRRT